jgi:hypothetical protein
VTRRTGTYLLAGLALVVAGAVVMGLWVLNSPATERQRRMDERRVADLAALSRAIDVVVSRRNALPSTLDDLAPAAIPVVGRRDPVTGEPYEFRVLGARTYELCANFHGSSAAGNAASFWSHEAGRQCFRLDARPVTP